MTNLDAHRRLKAPSGAHAVEFSKTVAPRGRGFRPGRRGSLAPPGGQESLAHPGGRASGWPRRARTVHAGASRRRRKRRLPTWSTRPSSRGRDVERLGRQRLAVEPHAALGQGAPRLRARAAEHGSRSARAGARSRRRPRTTASSIVLGRLARDEDAVERRLGRRGRAPAPWKRATSSRASARLASRGPTPAGDRRAQQQLVPGRERVVRDAQRLAVHLLRRLGDPDVVAEGLRHLRVAVEPGQQRQRQHHLRRLPVGAPGSSRPISRLNVWSVPPSSTSARTATES